MDVLRDESEGRGRANDLSTIRQDLEHRLDQYPVVRVAVGALAGSDSPRLTGENTDHVRALAESEATLPPILVHRTTMRVIDGMHRLRAAMLRGMADIEVRFFDGDEADGFVLAVKQNVKHGLPLSLAERKAAAERIVGTHQHWSDGVVAAATGLSAKTIGSMRQRPTQENPELDARVGRDGKARPLNSVVARELASAAIKDNPTASLREIAKTAGISPSTARDVRERLRRGDDPVPASQRGAVKRHGRPRRGTPRAQLGNRSAERTTTTDLTSRLQDLKQDPSVRLTAAGRVILRLLDAHAMGDQDWARLLDNVPVHCSGKVADAARECARIWQNFAEKLDQCRV